MGVVSDSLQSEGVFIESPGNVQVLFGVPRCSAKNLEGQQMVRECQVVGMAGMQKVHDGDGHSALCRGLLMDRASHGSDIS